MISSYRGKEDNNGKNYDADKESVVVEIKDTGAGINPEMMPRLFEKICNKINIWNWPRSVYIEKYC